MRKNESLPYPIKEKENKSKEKMKILVEKIDRLPTIPNILSQVIEVTEDSDSKAADLEAVIIRDPSISAKVVSFANSPYYGFVKKVVSLSHAISLVGFTTVKNVTVGLSVFSCFHDPYSPLSSKVNEFYLHSFAVGLAAEQLAMRSPACDLEPAFLCGFFHDIGKMVMIKLLDLNYHNIMEIAQDKRKPIEQVEKEVLGFDHAEVGAWLVESWNLPDVFVQTVLQHHSADTKGDPFPLLVSVADILVHTMGIGNRGDAPALKMNPQAQGVLSLTEQDISEVTDKINDSKDFILDMGRL